MHNNLRVSIINNEKSATRETPNSVTSFCSSIFIVCMSPFRAFPGIINHLWSKFEDYCDENNLKLEVIPGDGYCFLNAVRKCLLYDFYEFHTMKGFQQIITQHLVENCDKYTQWHGDADKLVFDATEFFNDRKKFNTDIVDVLVQPQQMHLGFSLRSTGRAQLVT